MFLVAITLGLFGSLHCVGMCGPLAIAFCANEGDSTMQRFNSGMAYNLGRTFTYAFLGLFFGLLGSFIVVVDLQKILSIVLGVLLVICVISPTWRYRLQQIKIQVSGPWDIAHIKSVSSSSGTNGADTTKDKYHKD